MNKLTILFFVAYFSFSSKCNGQGDNEVKKEFFVPRIEDLLKEEIPRLLEEQNVPAAGVGLIEDGQIKFIHVFGEHQLGIRAPENTIFNVASITKVITAMITLKLISQKQWELDEPLHNYWVDPDLKNNSLHKKITTRHALSHSIGFKNWRRMNETRKLEFDFEPGTKYQYSGEGIEYLRMALENRFSKDLGLLADSLLFRPLNMADATLKWISDQDTIRFAKWYDGNKNEHQVLDYSTPNASAADDLLITVEDLAKFGIAVMDTSLIDEKLFKEMIRSQVKIHNNAQQGLGWTVVNNLPNDNYLINHDGGDRGVATTIMLFPISQNGIIVFTNGDNGRIVCNSIVKKAIKFGNKIIQKLYWGGDIPEIIKIDPILLENYSGVYQTNQNTEISFTVEGNALKIRGEGVPGVEIYPKSITEFFPADFEVFFKFYETNEGFCFKLLSQEKIILEGTKQE